MRMLIWQRNRAGGQVTDMPFLPLSVTYVAFKSPISVGAYDWMDR